MPTLLNCVGSTLNDLVRVLAVILVEPRLGIERVDLRRPAVHVQEDDVLRLGRMMRGRRASDLPSSASERGEGDGAEAVGAVREHVAAGQRGGDKRRQWCMVAAFHSKKRRTGTLKPGRTTQTAGQRLCPFGGHAQQARLSGVIAGTGMHQWTGSST